MYFAQMIGAVCPTIVRYAVALTWLPVQPKMAAV
jgi:hypothetical protein